MDTPRVAYVTSYDAQDVRNWSGTGYHIAQALQDQGLELDYIGPLRTRVTPLAMFKRAYYRARGKIYLKDRDVAVAAGYARQVAEALRTRPPEVVFSPGTLPVAKLEIDPPIVVWTDATFAGLIETYPAYRTLCSETIRMGHALEAEALARCARVVYSSEWAADSAVRDYGVDRSKIRVISFGANVDGERSPEDLQALVAARSRTRLKLLFLAVDWHRKGGDIALEVAAELHAAGLPVELDIVGCLPPEGTLVPAYVRCHGRISKATAEGRAQLERLIAESHFLVLPTRADCTPVVLAEANAFGVPGVAPEVGGIGSLIRAGHNGHMVSARAPASDYASYIAGCWQDEARYHDLALSSYAEYSTRLNWKSAGRTMRALLAEVASEHRQARR